MELLSWNVALDTYSIHVFYNNQKPHNTCWTSNANIYSYWFNKKKHVMFVWEKFKLAIKYNEPFAPVYKTWPIHRHYHMSWFFTFTFDWPKCELCTYATLTTGLLFPDLKLCEWSLILVGKCAHLRINFNHQSHSFLCPGYGRWLSIADERKTN